MIRQRFEYTFELHDLKPSFEHNPLNSFILKNPSLADKNALAELMLDSYQGTIDYDGETIEDSITEIESYFSGPSDQKWLECSWLVFSKDELVCACLIDFWKKRNAPLIAYVMTSANWKGKHLAYSVVAHSLQSLVEKKQDKVLAVITDGNLPSEKIFTRIGFKRLASE
jgi:hypothetical protein